MKALRSPLYSSPTCLKFDAHKGEELTKDLTELLAAHGFEVHGAEDAIWLGELDAYVGELRVTNEMKSIVENPDPGDGSEE